MTSSSRRAFLRSFGATSAVVAMGRPDLLARVEQTTRAATGRSADDVAQDEDFWRDIREAFTLDRTIVNLNNGGVCPSPRVVHEAMKASRYLEPGFRLPHVAGARAEPRDGPRRLAAEFGCDAEELAVTRNASEALQIAQSAST